MKNRFCRQSQPAVAKDGLPFSAPVGLPVDVVNGGRAWLMAMLPLSGFAQEPVDADPDVTIRQEGDRTVEEYRVNGFLYAVKVTPKHGKPYFLVRADGDSNFVRADKPDMLIPAWEIFSW